MSASGTVDFSGVMLRAGAGAGVHLAHPSGGSLQLPPLSHLSGQGHLGPHPVSNPIGTGQYKTWETRESSPSSDTHSQMVGQSKEGLERTLNFSTSPHDDEYGYGKKKTAPRDPMSHRIIEKRRRDRMNNCLADLSRLIPSSYMRKGRGRIEKTEIIEMAIKHIRYLQSKLPARYAEEEQSSPCESPPPNGSDGSGKESSSRASRSYAQGYKDCFVEMLQFLVDVEGFCVTEGLCSRLLGHAQNAMDRMGHDLDLMEYLPADILSSLMKSRRDSSIEHEPRLLHHRSSRPGQKDLPGRVNGHRPRALSQSDIRSIRITSDYDSEAEMQASGGSTSPTPNSHHQNTTSTEPLATPTSSQLREMLQSPFHTWGRSFRSPAPQQAPPPTENSDTTPSPHSETAQKEPRSISPFPPHSTKELAVDASLTPYSFKRTIKERFKEELRRTSDPEIKTEDHSTPTGTVTTGKRRPDSRSSGSNDSMDGQTSLDCFPPEFTPAMAHKRRASASPAIMASSTSITPTIPIFALHSSGAFYVPSTLSVNLIDFHGDPSKAGTSQTGVCHPVTISVNFSMTATTQSAVASIPTLPTPATFPRPVFLTAPTAGPFLQNNVPFVSAAGMPFICSLPTAAGGSASLNSTVNQGGASGGNLVMRRGSLPVTSASHTLREQQLQPIHYAFGAASTLVTPPPLVTPSITTNTASAGGGAGAVVNSHALNLSQSHSRL